MAVIQHFVCYCIQKKTTTAADAKKMLLINVSFHTYKITEEERQTPLTGCIALPCLMTDTSVHLRVYFFLLWLFTSAFLKIRCPIVC